MSTHPPPHPEHCLPLDTDQAYDLLDKLNLPEYLREEFVEAEGTLRWYSPGYSSNPNEPDRLQRVGGLVAEGSLTADLFDVFDATFTGSLDSTGSYQFAAEDLSFAFPFGVGTISGQADFDLAGNVGTSDVELEGQFSGSLKVGNTRVATVNAAIDPYGCLQGNVSYLDSKNKIEFLQYPLQFGACGPQVLVDDAEFLETDVGVEHEVTVRLTRPAISDVVVFYNVEPISDNLDPRDKATEDDVVFHSTQKTVTIPQGQDQASLKVTVKGDNFWENPEIFQVRVVAAPGVTIADGTAIVTILDDDLDQLIDNVWGALEAGSRAIAWYDFQDDQQVFDATADDAPPVIVASPMTHALELEPAGRTGLPGENGPGRGASSTQWNDEQGYFEFTVTFDHDEPLDVRFDHLQFWDQTEPGKFNQRYQGPQVWEVFTSLDDFQTPLPREQTIVVDSDFFVQHGLPENTELDQLLGWRRQRFLLDSAVDPGYVSDLPLDLTFRLYGQHNVPTIIDNVELAGRVINPCESDLELACVARIVDDVVRWLDSLVGRIDVSVLGPGVLSAELIGRGGDIDPTRMQELAYLEVIGADPDLTTLLIEVENPGDLPAGASIPLGTVVSDKGLLRLDMSAIASALVNLEIGGPVSEMLVGGLADGSGVSLGGSAGDLTSIVATEDIGSAGGSGVSLATLGSVAVSGKSWYGGTWGVGAVTTVEIDGGDFTPDVAIEGGFDTFTVIDGNFAPPTFASGVAAGVGNGGGNVIQTLAGAKGLGGSILAGKLSVDGHLSGVQAMGGKIATNLTAQRIGSVQANRSARPGDAGNIEGRVQGTSIDSVQSLGGVITATLITSDPVHRGLEIEATAESQFPGSGRIDSRRSFHIAGGVASIRAHDIALHLVAGDRVDRIELIGDQGSLVADLTAPSFGLLQGRTAHLDLVLNTAPTQQPPPAGTMSWEVVAGASGALLDFELAELQRQMALTFTVDEQGVPEAMKAERLTPAAFEENVSGGTIGPLGVPTVWNGESLTVAISDSRFEIRKGQLALRRESHLQSNEQGGELVEVSAATADGRSRWFETFVVTVADNPFPWHHTARPLDTNGDDEVSPRDALLIINRLNAGLPTLLPSVRPAAEHEPIRWYDVAPDGFATARDALLVINHLNRQPSDGEGEGAVDSAATIDAVAGAPAVERIRNILRGSSSVGPREAAGRTASERSTDSVSHQRDLGPHATEFRADSGLLVGTADAPVPARDEVFRVQAGRREQDRLDEVLDDLAIQTLRLTASSNPH